MKEHPLALFHPHRFPVPQRATIDGEVAITHFVAVRHAFRERRFHCGLACRFQFFDSRGGSQNIHCHVAALTERRFELLEYEKHLPVVAPRLMPGLYVNGPDLATVLS